MKKTKEYKRVKFSPQIIDESIRALGQLAQNEKKEPEYTYLSTRTDSERWRHDSVAEFYADYRENVDYASLQWSKGYDFSLDIDLHKLSSGLLVSEVSIEAVSRDQIHAVFEIFESNVESSTLPEETYEVEKPVVFIGHGQKPDWRDLKDHLHEKHGYEIQAYEIGSRTGHAIRDILDDMLQNSSFAILVMTGEDMTTDGENRPRLNVVHEAGLFQGKLGFNKAIVLLEDGTMDFTNLAGIEQRRYQPGAIDGTFGDVIAALKREFPGT